MMVCFDTAPVIWGIQGFSHADQREMVGRTKRYIEYLGRERIRIMIPAPVLGEYLNGIDREQQAEHLSIIQESFFVPSLDVEAVALAAQIQSAVDGRNIRSQENITRDQLKTDAQVVAIAILQQAEKVITNDIAHLTRLAAGRIVIEEVPDILVQGVLPFNQDQ